MFHSYWSFTSSIVLLFSATIKLLEGAPNTSSVSEDLTFAKSCMDMLERCRAYEPVAARYLDIITPLYESLRDMHQRSIGRVKTSIFMLLQSEGQESRMSPPLLVSKAQISPISETLSVLLTDPFGRKQAKRIGAGDAERLDECRRILNQDGSCTVFWWK